MMNDSLSSADSYVAHVNDEPRLRSYSVESPTSNARTSSTTADQPAKRGAAASTSFTHAVYPTSAADSRDAAAESSAAARRVSAAGTVDSERRSSVPRERKASSPIEFTRSNSTSNNKIYFHTPPQSAASALPRQTAPVMRPLRRDVAPLREGAICTPSSCEDEHVNALSERPPHVATKARTQPKTPTSLSPVKPATRTPTRPQQPPATREDVKDVSTSLPFTSNQMYNEKNGDAVRRDSGALVRRTSHGVATPGQRSLGGASSRASQQKAPHQLVARMSLSQSNAGAMVPYVDESNEACNTSYTRDYELTMLDHKAPPKRLSVQRYVPTARQSEWNSNLKETKTAPLELLPSISLSAPAPRYARASSATSGRRTGNLLDRSGDASESHRVHSLPISSSVSPSHDRARGPSGSGALVSQQLLAHRYSESNAVQTYRDELGDSLDRVDFKRALTQLNMGHVGGEDYQAALAFFTIVAKDKVTLFPEDLHELLVLFTPPGVALREAEDFLWEECDHKTRLTFAEFVQYGTRLRDRVFDYEQFMELNDIQRLLVTYARVFPGKPSEDRDYARIRLLAAARDQLGDQLPDKFRPLRVYEHLFLVDYQHMLYRAGVIHSTELPPEVRGDLPSDVQAAARERRRQGSTTAAPAAADAVEDIEWGPTTTGAAPPAEARAPNKDRHSEYPSLARCNTSAKGKRHANGTAGSHSTTTGSHRGPHKGRQAPASKPSSAPHLVTGCVSSRTSGGGALRRSRTRKASSGRVRQPFEVRAVRDATADKTTRTVNARYMGTTLPADRRARTQEDDSLIQRLQIAYGAAN